MPTTRPIKTSFARGEIDPVAQMRSDIVALEGGADKIRNALVFPQGGVRRRDGMAFVDTLPPTNPPVLPALPVARTLPINTVRLIRFKFSLAQLYLIVMTVEVIYIYRDDVLVFEIAHPYTESQIQLVNWVGSTDTLLFLHPEHEIQSLQRQGADSAWSLTTFTIINPPTLVFDNTASGDVTPSATTGVGITLTFSAAQTSLIGKYVRGNGGFAKITAETDPTHWIADVQSDFTDTTLIQEGFWTLEEEAFSATRGWPVSGTFFQGRFCIAGTRDVPQLFATSKSGKIEDFFAGNADDDSGIVILADSESVVTFINIYNGRHLQIFGDDSEWYIPISEDTPITPKNSALRRNSSVGSKVGIRTEEVDGIVYFLQRGGESLRELVFLDKEAAYLTNTVSMIATHLVRAPIDMSRRKSLTQDESNYIWLVNDDGTLAAFCLLRSQEVNGWSLLNTQGQYLNVEVLDQTTYLVVDRVIDSVNVKFIEKFREGLKFDAGQIEESGGPYTQATIPWLANATVELVLDTAYMGEFVVPADGILVFPRTATTSYQVGLSFPFVEGETDKQVLIRTLPADLLLPNGTSMGKKKRVSAVTSRLVNTESFFINGNRVPNRQYGSNLLDQPIEPFTGDFDLRGISGWNRKGQISIYQNKPFALTFLGLAYDLST